MQNVTSNAYNFSEYISSGVDPRTGMYNLSIGICNFFSNLTSGPALKLQLVYNAASSLDSGFGCGWEISLSRYDSSSQTLFLSNGQSFKIFLHGSSDEYVLPYRRVKDIRVFYIRDTKEIKVVHKDGLIEFIDAHTGTLAKIVSNNGLTIFISYEYYFNSRVPSSIYDNRGQKISIIRADWETKIRHTLGNDTITELEFNKSDIPKRLKRVILAGQDTPMHLEYSFFNSHDYALITQVRHFSGLVEELTYDEEGHQLPYGAPENLIGIPHVSFYNRVAGSSQKDMMVEYKFSKKNYLGFDSGHGWSADKDILLESNQGYEYSSTETINKSLTIKRTYNKFHLMESAEYTKNNVLYKSEKNTFFAIVDRDIHTQPALYTFMKEQCHTYYYNGEAKSFISLYNYDEYGNQTHISNPDGSSVRRSYFPVQGTTNRCPPSPTGMVTFIDTETYYPSSTEHNEKPRRIIHNYIQLPSISPDSSGFILLSERQSQGITTQFSYYNDINKELIHGRLKKETITINHHRYHSNFAYEFGETTWTAHRSLTTHDGLVINANETFRFQDGKVIKQQNAEGILSHFEYDRLGRLTKEIFSPFTKYEAINHYDYSVGKDNNSITSTDPKGNKQVQIFNNAGNLIRVEVSDAQGILREITRSEYDAFGLLVAQHETDYLQDSAPITLTTKYKYDEHGSVSQIEHPDGRIDQLKQNLVELNSAYNIPGLMTSLTQYNFSGQELSQCIQDNSGFTLNETKYKYDGFGNLISTEDTYGRVTHISYDKLDRICKIERTVLGETLSQEMQHADFTIEPLVTRIQVNGNTLAQRQYDGLGRLRQEQTSAAGLTHFIYKEHSLFPIQKQTPLGTVNIDNDVFLNVIENISSEQSKSIYVYDKVSGHLLGDSTNNQIKQAYAYNKLGQLSIHRTQHIDGTDRQAIYNYSLRGKILSKTDSFGMQTEYRYDSLGRLTNVLSDESSTTIGYDKFSRPINFSTKDKKNIVVIELALNELGMEVCRHVFLNGIIAFSLEQTFNQNLQIVERIYTENGNETVEVMSYDELLRLVEYTCDGANRPHNEFGHGILKQQFSYDLFGNITQVKSDFLDNDGIADTNVSRYFYDPNSLVRLVRMTNSHHLYPQEIIFKYDAAGNLLRDDNSREYSYNALGQMIGVTNKQGDTSEYNYNATGQLSSQRVEDSLIHLYYHGDTLVNELCHGLSSHYSNISGAATSRLVRNKNGEAYIRQLLLPNSQGSTVASVTASNESNSEYLTRQFTAYGQG